MKTINEIKFVLKKKLPSPLFKVIHKTKKILTPVLEVVNYVKLTKFNKEELFNFNFDDEKFSIFINPKNGVVDNEIYLHGVYEPYFLLKIKEHISSGDIFVDIGANIGQHSLFAASIVGDCGRVISFEPIKSIYNQLVHSVEVNKFHNVDAYNFACGNMQSKKNISINKENAGASSLVLTAEGGVEEVLVIPADSILSNYNKIDFIKIDTEGFELPVLEGLSKTIEKFRPKIMLEFSPELYEKSNLSESGEKIIKLILAHHYKIIDLEDNDKIVGDDFFENMIKQKRAQTNFLCLPLGV
jgi:FkbM family methyltransferase